MIAPNTDIYLIKVPIEIDEMNQLTFNNIHDQYAYFMSHEKLYLDNATYQRKDNVIRYPSGDNYDTNYDQLLKYNYCCYRNDSYSDRVFYAFIKNMRYVNDGMTEIEIETDVFQTWQFDIEYKSSFIEREHVNNDTFGLHTVPEGLETGEYIEQTSTSEERGSGWNYFKDNGGLAYNTCIVAAVSESEFAEPSGDRQYGGVFSGLQYIAFPHADDCRKWIQDLQTQLGGKIDSIYAIFLVPFQLLQGINFIVPTGKNYFCNFVPFSDSESSIEIPYLHDDRKLGVNYVPKNNKALCFPYRYILVSNNAGQTNKYSYELFYENTHNSHHNCYFPIKGTICPGCAIKIFPRNYNVTSEYAAFNQKVIEGIDGYKLPTCGWLTDPYLNWLSENAVNLGIGSLADIGSIGLGAGMMAAGNPLGGAMVLGGAAGIFNSVKEGTQKAFEPLTAKGGQNQGDLNFAMQLGFTPYKMSIKDEYAKIIDDYFSTYGYKVNEVKIPNIHSRRYWNYIKTIDMNLTGDIPQGDLQKLKQIFNNGCTFWHDPNHFLDYSMNNSIL